MADFRCRISDGSAKASGNVPERPAQVEFIEYWGGLSGGLAPPFRRGVVTEPALREVDSSFYIEDGTSWMSMAFAPGVDPCLRRKEQDVSTRTIRVVPPSGRRVREMNKQIPASRLPSPGVQMQTSPPPPLPGQNPYIFMEGGPHFQCSPSPGRPPSAPP